MAAVPRRGRRPGEVGRHVSAAGRAPRRARRRSRPSGPRPEAPRHDDRATAVAAHGQRVHQAAHEEQPAAVLRRRVEPPPLLTRQVEPGPGVTDLDSAAVVVAAKPHDDALAAPAAGGEPVLHRLLDGEDDLVARVRGGAVPGDERADRRPQPTQLGGALDAHLDTLGSPRRSLRLTHPDPHTLLHSTGNVTVRFAARPPCPCPPSPGP